MEISNRKGFTLVELLIVIVVIGVLSAMMMLSSTEAVASAKVSNIVSSLHNWKTAVLEWYMDNIDKVNGQGKVKKTDDSGWTNISQSDSCVKAIDISKYLNGEFQDNGQISRFTNSTVKDNSGIIYGIREISVNGTNSYRWVLFCQLPTDKDKRLLEKLESRANSIGLLDIDLKPYAATGDNRHILHFEVMDFSK